LQRELYVATVKERTAIVFVFGDAVAEQWLVTIGAVRGDVQCRKVATLPTESVGAAYPLPDAAWLVLAGGPMVVRSGRVCGNPAEAFGVSANDVSAAVIGNHVAFARSLRIFRLPADPCSSWVVERDVRFREVIQQVAAAGSSWLFLTQDAHGHARVVVMDTQLRNGHAVNLPDGRVWTLAQRRSSVLLTSSDARDGGWIFGERIVQHFDWPPEARGDLLSANEDAPPLLFDGRKAWFGGAASRIPDYSVGILSFAGYGVIVKSQTRFLVLAALVLVLIEAGILAVRAGRRKR
jgi:hypothetical protein